ncbi:MAG: 16S rRNA (guanine(966)-N(2))-methyltransferase RsmD [Anaerococcus hydrogenalis]|uniref:16S rRNA (guanine(966)-N(2))-methyltransferase RsmD n=1 Tax=Anaerococcus hydrogenalis TaxID=33029 RepID=UPI0028FE4F41|nr:16S rRNA (guanine(966)-N(2))-methyltransferase RsmD [Anaerococcus hydrogenalis]MDU1316599.1 16S rRNA (guanine(966)-N(2))-methyltransferase RsmD [Anaerococcus hydrogenalis]MDU2582324.1 16S rRNA (guanine(966)-N(2))-methyltransferase RsmD [Anaerococcus hydrogenalis]MDU3153593.1 16S rRNA (guanine(966)-N(2))-methyltransferase RsmD [Anaerococcus hydrogenalis]
MRVVAGKYKGFNLKSPKANNSRPTDNKVKEAVLAMLYPYKNNFTALDLFACTGQMGIEFLSHGAKEVVFGELNNSNYKILKENLRKIDCKNAYAIRGDFRKVLEVLHNQNKSFDYIYLDPPYKEDYLKISMETLLDYHLLNNNGIIISESDRNIDFSHMENLQLIKEKKYGRKIVKVYCYESDISR